MIPCRHVVLQSPDILSGIFAHLDQADLARALRVCRLWNEWNDTLWSNLPTLAPVLRLVFPFVFTNDSDKYIHRVPLYQLDRHRFTSIARSVRHLDASLAPSRSFFSGFNPNIPALLLDLCEPCTLLFHNLRSLATECYNDAELLGVLSLLAPSLRSLDILIHHSASDYMYELLSGIKDRTNQLERLCIHYQQQEKSSDAASVNDASVPRNTDSYVYLPPIVPALVKSLRTLSIPAPCMSIDTLFALSRLPLLESLAFTGIWASETHEDDWPELDSYAFSALSRLVMPSCSVRAAARLLLAIPFSAPLGEIDITCSGEGGSELSELCSAMVRFKVSLHSVCIKIPHPGRVQDALEALTVCSRLETLVLDTDTPTDLSDVELGAFFSRFPRMRAARVGGYMRVRD
ncbi:hypothetical protein CTheo_6819 [Ceratobasidium theobromae]|uniref:F-box domain-containing protein n=1 Tax=Ceratobasidium theobromae TaxID=1582974 RepID=A0A5N5QDC0_9AGAM|nr:hypothetical protein CTheo_6819 [Ceratobasidium theobromae]